MKGAWVRNAFLGLLALSLLVILSFLIFREGEHEKVVKCAYDGVEIDPLYEVRFIMKDGKALRFCCIVNAIMAFPQSKAGIDSVLVTDEVTGQKLNAEKAFFIESSVVTVPHVKNRIHVFASEFDAVRHRDQYSGKHIENPFVLFSPWREEVIEGQKLRIKIDPITGLTRIVKGSPYILILKGYDLDNFKEEGAWKALEELICFLGHYLEVEREELKFAGMERVGGSWYISFWQTYGGVIIFESSIGFSIDPEGNVPSLGALLHKAHRTLNLPTRVKLTLKEATAIALDYLMKIEPLEYKLVAYQIVIYQKKKEERVVGYYLTYILNFYYPEELRVTRARAGWVCFVEGVTGSIVDVQHLLAIASCCMPVEDEK